MTAVPMFDVGDTVRVSDGFPLAAAGYVAIVASVDDPTADSDQILYRLTLEGRNPPVIPGGWLIDEHMLLPHDCDQEDDGA